MKLPGNVKRWAVKRSKKLADTLKAGSAENPSASTQWFMDEIGTQSGVQPIVDSIVAVHKKGIAHDKLLDAVEAVLSKTDLPVGARRKIAKTYCGLSRNAEKALQVIDMLGRVDLGAESISPQLIGLIENTSDEPDTLVELCFVVIGTEGGDSKSNAVAIETLVKHSDIVPDEVVEKICSGLRTDVRTITTVVNALRTEQRFADIENVLVHSQSQFPNAAALAFMRVSLATWRTQTGNAEKALEAAVRISTFSEHLDAIYGEYANVLPSVSRATHDALFPEISSAGNTDKANTMVAVAALIVVQIQRLKILRFGEARETTELRDWGAACFEDWKKRSVLAANSAAFLLKEALRLDGSNAEALRQLAQLYAMFGEDEYEVGAYASLMELDATENRDVASYVKSLCQVGRLDEGLEIARTLVKEPDRLAASAFRPMDGFSSRSSSTSLLPAIEQTLNFTAIKGTEVRDVQQPVRFDELDIHQITESRLIGCVRLLGKSGDALFADPRVELDDRNPRTETGGRMNRGTATGKAGMIFSEPKTSLTIEEPTTLLLAQSAMHESYYHALVQNFSRIGLLKQKGYLEERLFVVPDEAPNWVFNMIEFFGVDADHILRTKTDIAYSFNDLLLPTPARMTGLPNPEILVALRKQLGIEEASAPKNGRKIFWSREQSGTFQRSLMNESELRDLAIEHGFEAIDPASLSLQDQIKVLAETSIVAGPTGGAFANLLLAPRGIAAICTAPRQSAKNYYPALGASLGQQFIWVLGEYVRESFHGKGYPQLPYVADVRPFALALEMVSDQQISS